MKKLFSSLAVAALLLVAMPQSVSAQAVGEACGTNGACNARLKCINNVCAADVWGGYSNGQVNENSIQNATGLGDEDPRVIISRVINVILGFLGIIAVILILAGGFIWMTAAGNDDKIAQAKKIMSAGVVGLVIVLAAFGIARFVVNALVAATTQS